AFERVVVVAPEGVVDRVREVEAAEVAVSRDTRVVRADLVGPHAADLGRADEEAVLVVVDGGLVAAVVVRERERVPVGEEVLPEHVRDHDALVAALERVELAVRVLLEQLEPGGVVLPAIVPSVAEEASPEVRVVEDEPAEIRHERLDPRPERDEVVVAREGGELRLRERLLERDVVAAAALALAYVHVHEVPLLDAQVVQVGDARGLEGPGPRLERGLALEELDRNRRARRREELPALAEELALAGVPGATPLPTGSRRISVGPLSSTPVRTRNTESPMTGLSPFRTFWL